MSCTSSGHRRTAAESHKPRDHRRTAPPHARPDPGTRKRTPSSQTRAGANEEKCQRKAKVPGRRRRRRFAAPRPRLMPKARPRRALSVTPSADLGEPRRGRASPPPSMCCWRPEAPFAATMCHGSKTVGCPSRSWSSSAKPRQGATEHKHAKARRTASAAPPRCFHGAIRTRGVCRSQTDRVRRNGPLTRDAPRHRPSKAVAGWRDPGRPAPGLPGFAAARMKTRATGAPQRGSPRDPLFAVRAALLSTAVVSPASPAVAGLVLVTPPR